MLTSREVAILVKRIERAIREIDRGETRLGRQQLQEILDSIRQQHPEVPDTRAPRGPNWPGDGLFNLSD